MTHPSNATEFRAAKSWEVCPWLHAYYALRKAVMGNNNLAAPIKSLGGAVTVIEAQLSRDLQVPLTSVYGLLQEYTDWLDGYTDAKDEAESPQG